MGFVPDQEMRMVEVDFGGGAVQVYFRPMNLYEMDLVDKARAKGQVDAIVEQLMVRARKEDGTKMFQKTDRSKILRQFDPDAVLEVVNAMNKSEDGGELGN